MLQFSLQKKLHTAEGELQLTINGEINNGEFISLYGPSGAGKTSVLRMLAGFMKPEKGFIKINNEDWFNLEKRINLTTQQREIGFVFQDYALFPNMSVKENIAFALLKNEPKDIVEELLEFTGLSNLSNRKIQTLSGGQQQRVALARAIAKKPKLLLLDEPLSAIDQNMRQQLQETILQLHKKYHLTTILVSHDIDEIVKLSDKIIRIDNGKVSQYNSPTAFLQGIGYSSGLLGNILSINEKEITIFINNAVVNIPTTSNINRLNKGDIVEVICTENAQLVVKTI